MISFLAILFLLGLPASTGDTSNNIIRISTSHLIVHAAENSTINLRIEVKKGYHIQANEVSDEFMIPTTIKLTADTQILIGNQVFPSSKKLKLAGSNTPLDVLDGIFNIRIHVTTQKNIKRGTYQIKGSFTYQACDSRSCLFPRTIEFSIPVEII